MSREKRLAANRANAQRSTGPKSSKGKRRAAINALRHGLSVSIESSPLARQVPQIQALLVADGYSEAVGRDLALRILDLERNLTYLRSVIVEAGALAAVQMNAPAPGAAHFESARRASALLEDPSMLGPKKLLRTVERFARLHNSFGQAEADRLQERLQRADRHFRRAANQLVKGLRDLKS